MTAMRRLFPAAILVLLGGCAGDNVVLRPLPAVPDAAQSAEATLIRPRAIVAAEFPFYVVVGDQPVFDLRSGEHTKFRIGAGRQSLAIRCLGGPVTKPRETRIEHVFPAGGAAFFVVEPKYDCASLEPVDERAAAPLVARTRFRAVGTLNPMAQAIGESPAEMSSVPAPAAPPLAAATPAAAPQSAPATARDEVAAATVAWAEAFNSRDPARIVARYDFDAMLWGTSAQRLAAGPAAIAEYFKNARERPGDRVSLGEQHVRVYGDTAVDTGSYTFWVVRDGKTEAIPARYSIVYRYREGSWRIVDHHSSRIPAP
jgi:uncharacterized protein (TIGR02246 family)